MSGSADSTSPINSPRKESKLKAFVFDRKRRSSSLSRSEGLHVTTSPSSSEPSSPVLSTKQGNNNRPALPNDSSQDAKSSSSPTDKTTTNSNNNTSDQQQKETKRKDSSEMDRSISKRGKPLFSSSGNLIAHAASQQQQGEAAGWLDIPLSPGRSKVVLDVEAGKLEGIPFSDLLLKILGGDDPAKNCIRAHTNARTKKTKRGSSASSSTSSASSSPSSSDTHSNIPITIEIVDANNTINDLTNMRAAAASKAKRRLSWNMRRKSLGPSAYVDVTKVSIRFEVEVKDENASNNETSPRATAATTTIKRRDSEDGSGSLHHSDGAMSDASPSESDMANHHVHPEKKRVSHSDAPPTEIPPASPGTKKRSKTLNKITEQKRQAFARTASTRGKKSGVVIKESLEASSSNTDDSDEKGGESGDKIGEPHSGRKSNSSSSGGSRPNVRKTFSLVDVKTFFKIKQDDKDSPGNNEGNKGRKTAATPVKKKRTKTTLESSDGSDSSAAESKKKSKSTLRSLASSSKSDTGEGGKMTSKKSKAKKQKELEEMSQPEDDSEIEEGKRVTKKARPSVPGSTPSITRKPPPTFTAPNFDVPRVIEWERSPPPKMEEYDTKTIPQRLFEMAERYPSHPLFLIKDKTKNNNQEASTGASSSSSSSASFSASTSSPSAEQTGSSPPTTIADASPLTSSSNSLQNSSSSSFSSSSAPVKKTYRKNVTSSASPMSSPRTGDTDASESPSSSSSPSASEERRRRANSFATLDPGVPAEWSALSFQECSQQVKSVARALMGLGLESGSRTAIFCHNCPEWAIFHLGCMAAGCVPVGIPDATPSQEAADLLRRCKANVLLVGNKEQWEKQLAPVLKESKQQLRFVVCLSSSGCDTAAREDMVLLSWRQFMSRGKQVSSQALDQRINSLRPEKLATVCYTAGTLGSSKGVMLSHQNLIWTAEAVSKTLELRPTDCMLSFLSLAHIADQMLSIYVPIISRCRIFFAESIHTLSLNLREVQPTLLLAPPELWRKLYLSLKERLEIYDAGKKKKIKLNLPYISALWHHLGCARVRYAAVGYGHMPEEALTYFQELGMPLYETYGITEVSGFASFNLPFNAKLGTAGIPMHGVHAKLAEDGEILLRGPNVFMGYLDDDDATREVLDEKHRWCRTGDYGEQDPPQHNSDDSDSSPDDSSSYLILRGRKTDQLLCSINNATLRVDPQRLENELKLLSIVNNAVVFGGGERPYLTAVVSLDPNTMAKLAARKGLAFVKALYRAPHINEITQAIQKHVVLVNKRMATTMSQQRGGASTSVPTLKRFTVLRKQFSVERGELTANMMNVRRAVVERNYAREIEKMYSHVPIPTISQSNSNKEKEKEKGRKGGGEAFSPREKKDSNRKEGDEDDDKDGAGEGATTGTTRGGKSSSSSNNNNNSTTSKDANGGSNNNTNNSQSQQSNNGTRKQKRGGGGTPTMTTTRPERSQTCTLIMSPRGVLETETKTMNPLLYFSSPAISLTSSSPPPNSSSSTVPLLNLSSASTNKQPLFNRLSSSSRSHFRSPRRKQQQQHNSTTNIPSLSVSVKTMAARLGSSSSSSSPSSSSSSSVEDTLNSSSHTFIDSTASRSANFSFLSTTTTNSNNDTDNNNSSTRPRSFSTSTFSFFHKSNNNNNTSKDVAALPTTTTPSTATLKTGYSTARLKSVKEKFENKNKKGSSPSASASRTDSFPPPSNDTILQTTY